MEWKRGGHGNVYSLSLCSVCTTSTVSFARMARLAAMNVVWLMNSFLSTAMPQSKTRSSFTFLPVGRMSEEPFKSGAAVT